MLKKTRLEESGAVSVRMRSLALAMLAALLVVGSALAAGQRAASQPDPKQMTLRMSDMPAAFDVVRSRTGRYDAARAAKTSPYSASTFKAHGYIAGYLLDARWNLKFGDTTSDAVEITSATSLWRTARGAHWSLASTAAQARKQHARLLSTGGRIGDESYLYTSTGRQSGHSFRIYSLGWREGRVRATIGTIVVPKSAVSTRQPVRLAQKQERRIKAKMHP